MHVPSVVHLFVQAVILCCSSVDTANLRFYLHSLSTVNSSVEHAPGTVADTDHLSQSNGALSFLGLWGVRIS